MGSLRTFFKRHVLWAGFIAALAPLLVLLVLQYNWLVKLESASAEAGQAYLLNYMDGVFDKVLYFYRGTAERALNIPASYLQEEGLGRVASHFRKKEVEGAARLFVMDYTGPEDRLWYYDPASLAMLPSRDQAEVRSVRGACAPFRHRARQGTGLTAGRLVVDETDPDNYMILNPITDQEFRVVGVSGMVIDMPYFRHKLLPRLIRDTLDAWFKEDPKLKPIVKVIDPLDETAYESGWVPDPGQGVSRYFPWLFTHYRLVVQSGGATPEQWARSNFIVNMSLSGLLALVLVGGIILAFRAVSRELKLSEMKSDFVSNVSHELRTPLASIRVFGELMRSGRVNDLEKCRGYGEYIETESRRLTQLLNNILDFSRIESGARAYHFQECDLQELLEKVLRTFEVRFKHDRFQLRYDPPESPLPEVWIDPEAISQAIHNLLDNAMKYSEESREIEVGIETARGQVVLWVQDRGIGISRSEQRKIFERFHRVSTGAVHDVKGSGLGLAIVHHVVSAHGGEVKVRSETGKGSRFSIRLPPASAALGANGRPEAPAPADDPENDDRLRPDSGER